MRRIINIFLIPLMLFMAGCSSTPTLESTSSTSLSLPVSQDSAEALLQQASESTDTNLRSSYLLQAADLLYQQNNYDKADSALSLIDYTTASQQIKEQYMLIALSIAVNQSDANKARSLLTDIAPHFYQQTPPDTQRAAAEIIATAYDLTEQHLLAAIERTNTSALYSGDEYWSNHELIWNSLRKAPTSELSQKREKTKNYELQGWLELATDIKQNQISLEQQLSVLSAWLKQWPQHPAALKLPEELELLSTLPDRRPDSIALALPLTGALANAGKAVRDGFMATFYSDRYRTNSNTEITFYDTNGKSFAAVHQEILSNEPDLIIGPLDKASLAELSQMDSLPIPVLALNYLNNETPTPFQLYQFGLSAEDEALQLADKLWSKGIRRVATIMPENDWGQRIYQAFSDEWLHRNGEIVSDEFFTKKQLSNVVENLLSVNESKQRARTVRNTVIESLEFTPRRRQDIDAIVMIAKPSTARRLKPLFSFHYAGNIPIYSTSHIYSGTPSPQKDTDLNGVKFTETPWVLSHTNAIKHQIHQLFPKQSRRYDRLFALGSDTYTLTPRLILLERIKGSQVSGQTGLLTMNDKNQIHRKLDWARFSDGEPRSER
jgi:outer membrane PBP1 activator LpoA protein